VKTEEKTGEQKIWKGAKYFLILAVVVFAVSVLNPTVFVPAGSRGILLEWGQVKSVLPEGLNFKIPIVQSAVLIVVQTQKFEAESTAASKDLQNVHTKVALNYHLSPDAVGKLYRDVGMDYSDRVISPAVQESVKAATATYTAEQLITQRAMVKERIDHLLTERLVKYDVTVETTSITDFQFSDIFTQSIESKVTAEQLALKAENDLIRIKTEAQQKIESAKAEAESLRIQNEQLQKSKDVLALRWIEKWNGQLPMVYGGDSNLLLNMGLNPISNVSNQG
jgi:regulator of protease activity HflC (stomatin/prohibitin superfamily)